MLRICLGKRQTLFGVDVISVMWNCCGERMSPNLRHRIISIIMPLKRKIITGSTEFVAVVVSESTIMISIILFYDQICGFC